MEQSTDYQSTSHQSTSHQSIIITIDISSSEMLNKVLPSASRPSSIIETELVEAVEVIRLIHYPETVSYSGHVDISGIPYILSPTDDDDHHCQWTRDWIDIDPERMIMIEYCEECGATKKRE